MTPPTDNLYKFIAVSGVVLLISCLALESLETEKYLVAVSNEVAQKIEIEARGEGESELAPLKDDLERSADNIVVKKLYRERVKIYHYGMLLGLVAAVTGFSLWYSRLQKFIDGDISKNHQSEAE
ncbi:hypothetical protein MLD52_09660 [Puniceicoccaceae bacterium K14]|nr:hypothetical protein [Puniceicoccaceae bacterium K14]